MKKLLGKPRSPAISLNPSAAASSSETDRLANLINSHSESSLPNLLPTIPFNPPLLESLLTRFFSGHASAAKALAVFRFSLLNPSLVSPTPTSLDTTIHILSRARNFPAAIDLLLEVLDARPSLLSSKSLAVFLSRHAKFRSFTDTLNEFDRLERAWGSKGRSFGADEFNVLIRAFCVQRRMGEARHVFLKFFSGHTPSSKTINTLLLGFKEAGDLMAFDLFYHETVLRGFVPDVFTFNIRIDAYCKKNRLSDALGFLEEMPRKGIAPTVETFTTLIHGAGLAGDTERAHHLFDEMPKRGLRPDAGAYNALIGAFVRAGDMERGVEVMEAMEAEGIETDDVGYYILLSGFSKSGELTDDGFFSGMFRKMVGREFVPKARTVMLMMEEFCGKGRLELGLELWEYLLRKGCCPHARVLDVLADALCRARRSAAACRCLEQLAGTGRRPSDEVFRVLERASVRNKKTAAKLEKFRRRMMMMGGDVLHEEEDVQAAHVQVLEFQRPPSSTDDALSAGN